MTTEEAVVGAGVLLIFFLAVWRVVLQIRLVRLFLRRLFGRDR
jgi:hypothetical protein